MSQLGSEWVLGPDGLRRRDGARILLLDGEGRILLQRAHDVDNPSRSWWFTVGGGIQPGEDPRDAAVRELAEETGIQLKRSALIGPVATRSAVFDFLAETVRQDEVFFLATLPGGARPASDGWTAVERLFLDSQEWVEIDEIPRIEVEVFPADLHELLTELAGGWDGHVRELRPQGPVT